jgi:hypothetical protein
MAYKPQNPDPSYQSDFFDDLLYIVDFENNNSGTGSFIQNGVVDNTMIGALELQTGTTSSGATHAIYKTGALSNFQFIFGGGEVIFEMRINIPMLATSGDDYNYQIGFLDQTIFGGSTTNGVWFNYTRATATNWIINTSNGGTQTNTTTSIAVTTGWHKLRLIATAAGVCTFYIDSVVAGTISTNMPTASTNLTFLLKKSNGTTNINQWIDYIQYTNIFTIPR